MSRQQRINELEQLAADENITLPFPAEVIARLEEQGQYVNLTTGMVGSSSETISLTPIGEAELIAFEKWLKE